MADLTQAGSDDLVAERFYRLFQKEFDALLEKVETLPKLRDSERLNTINELLGRIAQLSNGIKDASSILPLYDQKIYSEKVRNISDALAGMRATFAPKSKFSFNRKKSGAPTTAAAATPQGADTAIIDASSVSSFSALHGAGAPSSLGLNEATKQRDAGFSEATSPPLLYPFKRGAVPNSVLLSSHHTESLIVPPLEQLQSCSVQLAHIERCFVDLSKQLETSKPFLGLAVRAVSHSVILCGKIDGSAHVTNLNFSVLAISCKQFRLHDSKNLDVYLRCTSRPIIENCQSIRFAKFPTELDQSSASNEPTQDVWNQVDDFNWPNQDTKSPNWSVLLEQDSIKPESWSDIASGSSAAGLDYMLNKLLRK